MKNKIIICLCSLLLIAGMMTAVMADTKSGEEIKWQAVSSGGSMNGTSTNYVLSGTVGQTAIGPGTSTSYIVNQGFWQVFEAGSGNCCIDWGTPGDANSDHAINLLDILYLIAHTYNTPPGPGNPDGCDELLDATGDGVVNLLDILYQIAYIYNTPPGPAPVCPSI